MLSCTRAALIGALGVVTAGGVLLVVSRSQPALEPAISVTASALPAPSLATPPAVPSSSAGVLEDASSRRVRPVVETTGAVAPPAYRLSARLPKTDLTEAASDDDSSSAAPVSDAVMPVPAPVKAVPAPPPDSEPHVNPPQRNPNVIYKGEGASDDEGG